jgi:ABC-type phosphate/phosphonate transport system substrate-binding protein
MYHAAPFVKKAWNELFGRVFQELGLDVELLEHPWPAPIESLWARSDLLCAFMCGWPFINSTLPMRPIAVPVPSPPRYQDKSRYCSEFLARKDSGWSILEQSFGHRFGFMTENSQSGFNAPRFALAPFAKQRGGTLFSAVVGPLDTPARALAALADNAVDVIALDSFYLDLLRAHRPGILDDVMTLACTPFTPMPLLVAAEGVPEAVVASLSDKLTGLHQQPQYAGLLSQVLVSRFELADRAPYHALNHIAAAAQQLGYQVIR